ncbi:nuclear transport factor 2 family protein [Nonomuraea sediminis]|uniref:nuclear transport factor 2 family protein n=1 Tax=Nonomuraea sediminis TaxID=2835864 RepID=UPI001BDCB4E8|nr:nuclear transport factor 2 family protein [Nonomuraea sediminis]
MNSNNPVVAEAIDAINNGDRVAFAAILAPNATMSDDDVERDLGPWIDKEIFDVNGRFVIETQDQDGLGMLVRFRNDTWGEMKTHWRFEVRNGKITRFETGQA